MIVSMAGLSGAADDRGFGGRDARKVYKSLHLLSSADLIGRIGGFGCERDV
ncbi:amino acid decarboxylase [Sesbania bispinosa]|nr:amino acid decarboxylase [Sesbania bispinosa]